MGLIIALYCSQTESNVMRCAYRHCPSMRRAYSQCTATAYTPTNLHRLCDTLTKTLTVVWTVNMIWSPLPR